MDLLERLRSRDRAAQRHHRIPLGIRSCQARDQIGDAGSRGCDRDASLSCHPSYAAGDEGGVLLVPAHDSLDRGIDESIEHSIDLGTWNPEDMCDAPGFEHADDQLGSVLRMRFSAHRRVYSL